MTNIADDIITSKDEAIAEVASDATMLEYIRNYR